MDNFKFNTVEEAIEAIKNGKMVLVTDDEDRENEGDLIMAAQFCTGDDVNFMAKYARGLICMPADPQIMDKLQFGAMVANNTDNHETAFRFLSTMLTPLPAFLPMNAPIPCVNAPILPLSRRISAARGMCFRSAAETAAF